MNWDAVAAIAQILGTGVILITLIYLAIQIKYARVSASDASRAHRVVGIRELNSNLMLDMHARAAWNKSIGPGQRQLVEDLAASLDLTFDEASIVVLQGWNWMFTHWAQFRSLKSRADEEELRNIIAVWYGENPMRALLAHPLFRGSFDSAFVAFVDKIVSSPEDEP